jgi:hypothetical protein
MSSLSASAVLFRAARAHNVAVMRAALAAAADANAPHRRARTPLHAAVLSVSAFHPHLCSCPRAQRGRDARRARRRRRRQRAAPPSAYAVARRRAQCKCLSPSPLTPHLSPLASTLVGASPAYTTCLVHTLTSRNLPMLKGAGFKHLYEEIQ